MILMGETLANKKELVTDLVSKAKQVETLIRSLPIPESEEVQVSVACRDSIDDTLYFLQALRLQRLEEEMQEANEGYLIAMNRASKSGHSFIYSRQFFNITHRGFTCSNC